MNTEDRVLNLLRDNGLEFEILEHKPIRTSKEASEATGIPLKFGVKTMLLKTDLEEFIMALVPGNRKVDFKKIAGLLECDNVKLASAEEVKEIAGCEPGCVPPFGLQEEIAGKYLEISLLKNSRVAFSPANRGRTILMERDEFLKCIEAEKAEII